MIAAPDCCLCTTRSMLGIELFLACTPAGMATASTTAARSAAKFRTESICVPRQRRPTTPDVHHARRFVADPCLSGGAFASSEYGPGGARPEHPPGVTQRSIHRHPVAAAGPGPGLGPAGVGIVRQRGASRRDGQHEQHHGEHRRRACCQPLGAPRQISQTQPQTRPASVARRRRSAGCPRRNRSGCAG